MLAASFPSLISLRHLLRERTREAHDCLDREVGDIADAADYRRYLRGLHAFRAPAEAALRAGPLPAAFADWTPPELAPRIEADLRDLGEPVPGATRWDDQDGASAAAGLLYVLEGAAVGANLLRVRAERLGFHADHGARHLSRPADGGRWRAFVARLDAAAPAVEPEAAVAGARRAFDRAHRAFLAARA